MNKKEIIKTLDIAIESIVNEERLYEYARLIARKEALKEVRDFIAQQLDEPKAKEVKEKE